MPEPQKNYPAVEEDIIALEGGKIFAFVTTASKHPSCPTALSLPEKHHPLFENCKVYVTIASDHGSFWGNDMWKRSNATQEGALASVVSLLYEIADFTSVRKQFEAAEKECLLPQRVKWIELSDEKKIQYELKFIPGTEEEYIRSSCYHPNYLDAKLPAYYVFSYETQLGEVIKFRDNLVFSSAERNAYNLFELLDPPSPYMKNIDGALGDSLRQKLIEKSPTLDNINNLLFILSAEEKAARSLFKYPEYKNTLIKTLFKDSFWILCAVPLEKEVFQAIFYVLFPEFIYSSYFSNQKITISVPASNSNNKEWQEFKNLLKEKHLIAIEAPIIDKVDNLDITQCKIAQEIILILYHKLDAPAYRFHTGLKQVNALEGDNKTWENISRIFYERMEDCTRERSVFDFFPGQHTRALEVDTLYRVVYNFDVLYKRSGEKINDLSGLISTQLKYDFITEVIDKEIFRLEEDSTKSAKLKIAAYQVLKNIILQSLTHPELRLEKILNSSLDQCFVKDTETNQYTLQPENFNREIYQGYCLEDHIKNEPLTLRDMLRWNRSSNKVHGQGVTSWENYTREEKKFKDLQEKLHAFQTVPVIVPESAAARKSWH